MKSKFNKELDKALRVVLDWDKIDKLWKGHKEIFKTKLFKVKVKE